MIGRSFALILLAVALAACGRDGPAATLDAPIQLAIGQAAVFDDEDLQVQVVDVADSRCPTNVACFWAGEAVVRLEIRSQGKQSQHEIKELQKAAVAGYTVHILEVLPARGTSEQRIARADYRVTLKVTRPTPQ